MGIDKSLSDSEASPFPLGDVIAERSFTLYEADGAKRQICVRIGRPVLTALNGSLQVPAEGLTLFRCPLQITGLDYDERVFAPAGGDPIMALQYAIHLAGGLIDGATERLSLVNALAVTRERHHPGGAHFTDAGLSSWLWHYDCCPDQNYGLQFG